MCKRTLELTLYKLSRDLGKDHIEVWSLHYEWSTCPGTSGFRESPLPDPLLEPTTVSRNSPFDTPLFPSSCSSFYVLTIVVGVQLYGDTRVMLAVSGAVSYRQMVREEHTVGDTSHEMCETEQLWISSGESILSTMVEVKSLSFRLGMSTPYRRNPK